MSNRKNTGAAKSVAKAKPAVKSVAKPVANTVHSSASIEMSTKIDVLSSNKPDDRLDLLLSCLKSVGALQVRKAIRAAGI